MTGDQLFALKLGPSSKIDHGSVVLYDTTDSESRKTFIKRVVGLPGDTVRWTTTSLEINGHELSRKSCSPTTYTYREELHDDEARVTNCFVEHLDDARAWNVLQDPAASRWTEGQVTVGDGELFVIGDNRDNSLDSRATGVVSQSAVVGTASQVWLSVDEHWWPRPKRIGLQP